MAKIQLLNTVWTLFLHHLTRNKRHLWVSLWVELKQVVVFYGSGCSAECDLLSAGTRDRGGRPLLTASSSDSVWLNPDCDSAELLRLLLYYTSTLRYTPAPPSVS